MARVRDVPIEEVSDDLKPLYRLFTAEYGSFGNQVRIIAHSPPALRHLCGLLVEWRGSGSLPRRLVEIAVVTVSRINRCPYCIAHHGPALVDLGIRPEAVKRILEPSPPGFDEIDVLVRDYARLVVERAWGIRDDVFARLRRAFTERQIVELTLRISICNLFNQFNNALQIEIEEEALADALSRGLRGAMEERDPPPSSPPGSD
ncbi:MAG: carboxymuconolactone decarboxylase family protein [Pseudomonadota bacterium]